MALPESAFTQLTRSVTAAGADADPATATLQGALTEAAPATDTASSGLNGRLQRIAQRLTSMIAQLPASLGIKTAAASLSVCPASDATFSTSAAASATGGYSFNNITTNATTVVKSGVGSFHTLVINTRGVGNLLTIYDNTAASGTKIAIVDTTLSTTSFLYDVAFTTGLTMVTAGGTPPDITVTYK